ncbi:hypothetical protein SRB5_12060 [Streptomyces sp. RB5]|uniref:Uncharacterized protein n=1 Tax=Streptomyces smaragdinus TaxID=2585196 RepID=A0A7K0CDE2_9ACTN|nr:hypothetical protein [Streptomyces smaragdinus]MQY11092.1 hypothetical protein [Streptomyces smaragdinus]
MHRNPGLDWTATAYDEDFRKPVAQVSFTELKPTLDQLAKKAGGTDAALADPCSPGLSPLSPDGKRLAIGVKWPDQMSGSAVHGVGWVNLDDSSFEDLTQAASASDYAAEEVLDQNPGFAADGSFWFVRGDEYQRADAAGKVTKHEVSGACYEDAELDGWYQAVEDLAVPCAAPVHPSGGLVVRKINDGLSLEPVGKRYDSLGALPDGGHYSKDRPPATVVTPQGTNGPTMCSPVTWLSETELLCESAGFFTLKFPADLIADAAHPASDSPYPYPQVPVAAEVAPPSDREILTRAVSADRTALYILAGGDTRGGPGKVYRADLTQPGKPAEIGPLPPGAQEADSVTLRMGPLTVPAQSVS